MQAPQFTPLSRQTADILEKEILAGRWQATIPGERALCKELGISRKTLQTALTILTRRKLLLAAEPGKKRRLAPQSSKQTYTENRLIILSTTQPNEHYEGSRGVIRLIQRQLSKKEWQIEFLYHATTKYDGKAMAKILEGRTTARWLFIHPNTQLLDWGTRNQLRFVSLGGQTRQHPSPSVGVPAKEMILHATQQLIARGHHRAVTLFPDFPNISRGELSNLLAETYSKKRILFSKDYHFPQWHGDTSDALLRQLESSFSVSPPSALILLADKHLATVMSFCIAHDIKIPTDLSIVMITTGTMKNWVHPQLAYYDNNSEKAANKLIRWIEHYPTTPTGPSLLAPKFIDGESIATPKVHHHH